MALETVQAANGTGAIKLKSYTTDRPTRDCDKDNFVIQSESIRY